MKSSFVCDKFFGSGRNDHCLRKPFSSDVNMKSEVVGCIEVFSNIIFWFSKISEGSIKGLDVFAVIKKF